MKSRCPPIILSVLILSLALQTITIPALAQSEPNQSQAEFENIPPELENPYQRHSETGEHPDTIPPSPEIIAKTREQVNSFTCTDDMDVPKIECEALVALYESTNGAGWQNNSNWLQTTTISTWLGVYLWEGGVTGLDLNRNELIGTIPRELGNLSNLELLTLTENQLTGSIPVEFGNLSNLKKLNF